MKAREENGFHMVLQQDELVVARLVALRIRLIYKILYGQFITGTMVSFSFKIYLNLVMLCLILALLL